jgi:hypothetical protein
MAGNALRRPHNTPEVAPLFPLFAQNSTLNHLPTPRDLESFLSTIAAAFHTDDPVTECICNEGPDDPSSASFDLIREFASRRSQTFLLNLTREHPHSPWLISDLSPDTS